MATSVPAKSSVLLRQMAWDGHPLWIQHNLLSYCHPQHCETDQHTCQLVRQKLSNVYAKGIWSPGLADGSSQDQATQPMPWGLGQVSHPYQGPGIGITCGPDKWQKAKHLLAELQHDLRLFSELHCKTLEQNRFFCSHTGYLPMYQSFSQGSTFNFRQLARGQRLRVGKFLTLFHPLIGLGPDHCRCPRAFSCCSMPS